MRKPLALLGALLLAGCQTPEAGRSQAPAAGISITAYEGASVTVTVNGDGSATATAAPSSEASQTSTQTTSTSATIPVK